MTEFIEEVDGSHGLSRTEHALRSVLNCDIDSARSRLTGALEKLDYNVISDEPLYARRRARGLAVYYLSADILEYPIKLTIGLRRLSPDATLATFDYVAEHTGSISFKGDEHTLTREAEAIIALATSQTPVAGCRSCGTEQISDARFCRVCGQATVGREPAELEILRLAAGARAGQHLIAAGAVWTGVSFFGAVALMILGLSPGGFAVGLVLTQVVVGLLILLWGLHNLSRTLTASPTPGPDSSKRTLPEIGLPRSNEDDGYLSGAPRSITEGTTELLVRNVKGREKEAIYSKKRDTSPMD